MFWLIILIIAYLLNASSGAINKYLIESKIPNPAVFTFFVSALSLLTLLILPFDFRIGNVGQMSVALLAGITFSFALYYMFKAIDRNELSRIGPYIGGWQPIFILLLAAIFLGEWLTMRALLAFAVIFIGTILISRQPHSANKNHDKKAYLIAFISALFFAVSYTLNKGAFNELGFISGLAWSRLGAFIGALILLIPKNNFNAVVNKIKNKEKEGGSLFLVGQIAGAVSAFLVYWAISVSPSVAIVNATRGMEYVFLLILVLVFSKFKPEIFNEQLSKRLIVQKVAATLLIIVGLFILFL